MRLRMKKSLRHLAWKVRSEQATVRTKHGTWHITLSMDTSGSWSYRIFDEDWHVVAEAVRATSKSVARFNATQRLSEKLFVRRHSHSEG